MKKSAICLLVAIVSLVVFWTTGGGSWIQNCMGSFLGFGNCPNCGDSWSWKEFGDIHYGELQEGKDYTISKPDFVVAVHVSAAVMICKECLVKAERLDPIRIEKDLIDHGWSLEDAVLAKAAVIRYKEERLQNQQEKNNKNN